MELEQAVRDVGVVVEEAAAADATVADAAQHAAVLAAQRPEQEAAELHGGVEPVASVEPPRGLRERREREAVPRCDRLVVAEGLGPLGAQREQPLLRRSVEIAAHDRAAVLERLEQRLIEPEFLPLRGRPGVRQPLDAVGVGVLRGGEAAPVDAHLAQQVVDCLLHDRPVALVASDDPGVEVRRGEKRVVVEHLLEVRDEPPGVHRVAVEAAADDVVEAAGRHPVERAPHHPERLGPAAPQQQLDRRRRRELRRHPEAAEGGLVVAREAALRGVEQVW